MPFLSSFVSQALQVIMTNRSRELFKIISLLVGNNEIKYIVFIFRTFVTIRPFCFFKLLSKLTKCTSGKEKVKCYDSIKISFSVAFKFHFNVERHSFVTTVTTLLPSDKSAVFPSSIWHMSWWTYLYISKTIEETLKHILEYVFVCVLLYVPTYVVRFISVSHKVLRARTICFPLWARSK